MAALPSCRRHQVSAGRLPDKAAIRGVKLWRGIIVKCEAVKGIPQPLRRPNPTSPQKRTFQTHVLTMTVHELTQYNSLSLQSWSDSWRQRLHNAAKNHFTAANVGFS